MPAISGPPEKTSFAGFNGKCRLQNQRGYVILSQFAFPQYLSRHFDPKWLFGNPDRM
jgi:hypothetical protein